MAKRGSEVSQISIYNIVKWFIINTGFVGVGEDAVLVFA